MNADDASALSPYAERKFGYLGLWKECGWNLKLYAIHHEAGQAQEKIVPPTVLEGAKGFIRKCFSVPDTEGNHYHQGFVILHQGVQENWLVWYWWAFDNICSQVLANSSDKDPETFHAYHGPITACIWEMMIVEFERRAWIENVLSGPRLFSAYQTAKLPDGCY